MRKFPSLFKINFLQFLLNLCHCYLWSRKRQTSCSRTKRTTNNHRVWRWKYPLSNYCWWPSELWCSRNYW